MDDSSDHINLSINAEEQSENAVGAVISAASAVPSNENIKRSMHGSSNAESVSTMTARSAPAAAAMTDRHMGNGTDSRNTKEQQTTNKVQTINLRSRAQENMAETSVNFGQNISTRIPRSNPSSREVYPMCSIFAPSARRCPVSGIPHGGPTVATGVGSSPACTVPQCLSPRVLQLRKEASVNNLNSREVNHERETHSAMQMSRSWADLTLVTKNWSCKSDEFSNPLQRVLAAGTSCSSPSPTSNRAGLRLPYGLSPSPKRRTFATRHSTTPFAMRPSQLGPVKRKFELDDNGTDGNWNIYSPPPLKKIFTESSGSSPICQSPSSVCPSPDSGTYDGRITPKLFISELCTKNTNNSSTCSSPSSSIISLPIDSASTSGLCSSTSSTTSSLAGGSEPTCIASNVDEGISVSESDVKLSNGNSIATIVQSMSTDMQDDGTLMDDVKCET